MDTSSDVTPACLLSSTDLEYAVSPDDVHISPEGVDCPVGLGHGHHSLGLGVLEGGLSLAAKGHAHCEVLRSRLVRLHGGRVVVKWLPLTGVAIPVESSRLSHFIFDLENFKTLNRILYFILDTLMSMSK